MGSQVFSAKGTVKGEGDQEQALEIKETENEEIIKECLEVTEESCTKLI